MTIDRDIPSKHTTTNVLQALCDESADRLLGRASNTCAAVFDQSITRPHHHHQRIEADATPERNTGPTRAECLDAVARHCGLATTPTRWQRMPAAEARASRDVKHAARRRSITKSHISIPCDHPCLLQAPQTLQYNDTILNATQWMNPALVAALTVRGTKTRSLADSSTASMGRSSRGSSRNAAAGLMGDVDALSYHLNRSAEVRTRELSSTNMAATPLYQPVMFRNATSSAPSS